jgi:hypothetical protein
MTPILDRFIKQERTVFVPETRSQVFALKLAEKLNDAVGTQHYMALADQYSEHELLTAFRRSVGSSETTIPGERFHVELGKMNGNGHGPHGECHVLLAIRVERRSLAVAVFKGEHLEYTDCKQFSSDKGKALNSALSFINWIVDAYLPDFASMETINRDEEIQRKTLDEAIERTLHERVLPIWRVAKPQILSSFGYPPLRFRKQLREVISGIWPVLNGTRGYELICDAVALGLHVDLERRFLVN